jgi:hypothetical protein
MKAALSEPFDVTRRKREKQPEVNDVTEPKRKMPVESK